MTKTEICNVMLERGLCNSLECVLCGQIMNLILVANKLKEKENSK